MNDVLLEVLLVEDNPGDVRLVQLGLTGSPLHLTTLKRVGDAERWVKENHVDVIMLDLALPDSSGTDTVRRVHAASPATPLVVLTASEGKGLTKELAGLGVVDILVKGVYSREKLTELVWRAAGPPKRAGRSPRLTLVRPAPTPPRSPSTSSPIDPAALQDLRNLAPPGEEEALVREVVAAFVAQGALFLRDAPNALAGEDGPALKASAHSLKSVSAQVGATRLSRTLAELEELVSRGVLLRAPALLETATQQLREAEAALTGRTQGH